MLNKQDKILILILVAATFIIYANSFQGQIFWDGYFEIINNQYVKGFQIDKFFTENLFAGAGEHDNFYRPMGLLTYALDYKIWGLNPFGFHLTNVLLEALTVVLIYLFFALTGSRRPVSFLTAFLFAVNPFNLEITSYVNGRHELLSVLFLMLNLVFFTLYSLKEKKRNLYYILSLLSLVLAILSKESAVIYPVLLSLVYLVFLKKEEDGLRALAIKTGPFFIISATYVMLRLSVINFGIEITQKSSDIITRSLSFLKSLLVYWRILFAPYDAHLRLEQQLSFKSWEVILSGLIIILIAYFSYRYIKKGSNILFFGFSWFFISLIPVSGILYDVKYALGDRWLHLAAIGILFIVSYGLDGFFRNSDNKLLNNFLIILLAVYVVWLSSIVVRANLLWRDQITYFEYLLKIYPEDLETHVNLGVAYDENGRKEDAFREYKKAVELDAKVYNVHANLGGYYAEKKQLDLAVTEYKKTIVLNDGFTYAYQALAQIYAGQKQYAKAESILKMLIQVIPASWKPYSLIGDVYLMERNYLKAKESFEKGLQLDPGNEHLEKKLKALSAY